MKEESTNLDEKKTKPYRNKFELIAIASKRARNLREGKKKLVDNVSDKEPVIALNEILSGRLEVEIVEQEDKASTEGK